MRFQDRSFQRRVERMALTSRGLGVRSKSFGQTTILLANSRMQQSPHVVDFATRGISENHSGGHYGLPTDALRFLADARWFAYHSDTSRIATSTAPLATVASGVENATWSRISRPGCTKFRYCFAAWLSLSCSTCRTSRARLARVPR
jgi:hypothetical protein